MSNEAVGEAQANISKPVNMTKELAAFYQALGNLNGVLVQQVLKHPKEIGSIIDHIRDILDKLEECPGGQTFDPLKQMCVLTSFNSEGLIVG